MSARYNHDAYENKSSTKRYDIEQLIIITMYYNIQLYLIFFSLRVKPYFNK